MKLATLFTLIIVSLAGCSDRGRYKFDLASDTTWQLSIDDGPWRSIKVPGGGYNSDLQEPPLIDLEDVKDHVTYTRSLQIPDFIKGEEVLKINFGAVNHGCDVYLDEQYVGGHVGPMMPFDIDITDYAEPGREYELKVISYPQWHYNYEVPHGFVYYESRNHPETKPDWASEPGWGTKFSYGITGYIKLTVLPAVYIKDIFVQPSVSESTLKYALWICNHTDQKKEIAVKSELTSLNGYDWKYPELEPVSVSLAPGQIKKVTVGPIRWDLGEQSYWWPNKPFREDYQANLHNLTVTISEKKEDAIEMKNDRTEKEELGSVQNKKIVTKNTGFNKKYDIWHTRTQRFGFVEWTEGPGAERSEYYMVNGVRINQISDGTPEAAMSEYDCYSTSPAFLPPTDSTGGCPETWKRYMRLGISANRIHQSTPTEYMLDAADETGFMLIPETAIRGCQEQKWHDTYLPQAVMELAQLCRNHPSVCRYSLQNEADSAWMPVLIDSIKKVDPLRPLVFEDNQINKPARIKSKTGHAYAMLHYTDYPKPAEILTGMGEYAWHWADRAKWGPVPPAAEGGIEEFIYYGGDMRRWDIVYLAGWDFINYWPNFLEDMTWEKHAWKQSSYNKDRIDGDDGWGSPLVKWMQKYFHPFLLMDIGIHEMNGPDSDLSVWPEFTTTYAPGDEIEREIEIFNDGLSGSRFSLAWEARWDSAGGELAESGKTGNLEIDPGFDRAVILEIIAPQVKEKERRLYIVMISQLNGEEVFREEEIYFLVVDQEK